jgi:hypothetical protein
MATSRYLVAHSDKNGHNTAQAVVLAATETKAKELFAKLYPQRVLVVVGLEGDEGDEG